MEQTMLTVQGMSCRSCVNSIEGNLGKLSGVESVKVHFTEGKVEVAFDSNVLSLEEITTAIENQGYAVEA